MKLFFFFLLFSIFITGCNGCKDICDTICPDGYVQDLCSCECNQENSSDLDDIFDNDPNINPPTTPK
jgi:hypothetical protein